MGVDTLTPNPTLHPKLGIGQRRQLVAWSSTSANVSSATTFSKARRKSLQFNRNRNTKPNIRRLATHAEYAKSSEADMQRSNYWARRGDLSPTLMWQAPLDSAQKWGWRGPGLHNFALIYSVRNSQALGNHFSTGGGSRSKIKFYHVTGNVDCQQWPVVIAITSTPVRHKRRMQFLTSAPNFRGSADPRWPGLSELLVINWSVLLCIIRRLRLIIHGFWIARGWKGWTSHTASACAKKK